MNLAQWVQTTPAFSLHLLMGFRFRNSSLEDIGGYIKAQIRWMTQNSRKIHRYHFTNIIILRYIDARNFPGSPAIAVRSKNHFLPDTPKGGRLVGDFFGTRPDHRRLVFRLSGKNRHLNQRLLLFAYAGELIGIISGISLFLISYHGYSRLDSVISKLAGLFALIVGFVPTAPVPIKHDPKSIIHYLAAAVFFILLSYMSICLFTKTGSGSMTKQKKERNWIYRFCGITMLFSVSCIALDNIPIIKTHIPFFSETIFFETIALTFFGVSWQTKGEFILKDK
jgi:hypothetical protein